MTDNRDNILSTSDIEKITAGEDITDLYNRNLAILKRNCISSLVFCIPLLIIAIFANRAEYTGYIMWALATPVVVIFGKQFFIKAWRQIWHLSTNTDTLVALSTGTAYVVSVFNTIYPAFWTDKGLEAYVYFEVSALVVAFVLLGRYLEYKAKRNITIAIRQLIGMQPRMATIVQDGREMKVPVKDLRPGDEILVKPGERIAVDGKITEGSSFINESMISGEAMPVEKGEGKKVYAGTMNETGSFRFEATRVGRSTLLGQIVRMIQEGQNSRRPLQKTADKVSAVFIPIIGVIAALTLLAWWQLSSGDGFMYGLHSMVTVLIMACPCALGLATPTAIMAGINKGASNGILIKDDEALENARNLTSVVLDKTGTVTEGIFRVTDMKWLTEPTSELKGILYSIESHSEHPLADAVKQHLRDDIRTRPDIAVSFVSGKGLTGETAGDVYFVGTPKVIEEQHIAVSPMQEEWIDTHTNGSNTVVLFAGRNAILAMIAISDTVKPTSKKAIEDMKAAGLGLYMLTGDSKRAAEMAARQVGIDPDNIMAGALPAGKADFVKGLKEKGGIVAMTGDGINDVGALAMADVSFAMGKGSDVAMEVAQVTISSNNLNKLNQTIRLSETTMKTVNQNLFWAFIFNIISLPVAAGALYNLNDFHVTPLFAGMVMILSSVSVAINSLLLRRKKI